MRSPHARGQMEMVGLVFVVLIIVVGIILYVSFSGRGADGAQRSKESQAYKSFVTAFGETDIPACGMPASRVAQECLFDDTTVCGGDPCGELQQAIEDITEYTLEEQGIRFNMSLEGKPVGVEMGCDSSVTSGLQWASLPIGGMASRNSSLRLSVCSR